MLAVRGPILAAVAVRCCPAGYFNTVRAAIAGIPRARLTAAGFGAMAMLGFAAVSGCSSPATPTAAATNFTATAGGSAPPTAGSGSTVTATPVISVGVTMSPTTVAVSPTPTIIPTPAMPRTATPRPRATRTPVVTTAPETGGGGTAGLQDGTLFAIGGVAILAGAGSLGYRKRLNRKR